MVEMKMKTNHIMKIKSSKKKLLMISYDKKKKQSICLYEGNKEKRLALKPYQILEELCLRNGSSYEGRKESFCFITGARQKPGILISERTQDIYFPTTSKKNEDCVWVLYNQVFKVKSLDQMNSKILFLDGTKVNIPYDSRILNKQLKRCALFLDGINLVK